MDPHEFTVLKEWIDKVRTWDLRNYLVHNISIGQAVSIGAVFWPEFVEVDGCVIIEFQFDGDAYQRWRSELGADNAAIERIMNHLHLWDVFAPSSDSDYLALAMLAGKIAETWRTAAKATFPGREISVDVMSDQDDYGPSLVLYTV